MNKEPLHSNTWYTLTLPDLDSAPIKALIGFTMKTSSIKLSQSALGLGDIEGTRIKLVTEDDISKSLEEGTKFSIFVDHKGGSWVERDGAHIKLSKDRDVAATFDWIPFSHQEEDQVEQWEKITGYYYDKAKFNLTLIADPNLVDVSLIRLEPTEIRV